MDLVVERRRKRGKGGTSEGREEEAGILYPYINPDS